MHSKTILCYGDSNTYGLMPMTSPASTSRFAVGERWTSVLQNRLGSDYRVIEEGLSARTTVHDDPIEGLHKNGFNYLLPCLESHNPIDIVVLMLGTNDLKARFSVGPADIAASVMKLIGLIRSAQVGPHGKCPEIVLMAPVPIQEIGFLGEIFLGGAEKSKQLAPKYRLIAEEIGAAFIDAGEFAVCSAIDGIHYDADQHQNLANAVADLILNQFK
jgi:lysophospholipase L1-like esterase